VIKKNPTKTPLRSFGAVGNEKNSWKKSERKV
jgi:hypothetical protein